MFKVEEASMIGSAPYQVFFINRYTVGLGPCTTAPFFKSEGNNDPRNELDRNIKPTAIYVFSKLQEPQEVYAAKQVEQEVNKLEIPSRHLQPQEL